MVTPRFPRLPASLIGGDRRRPCPSGGEDKTTEIKPMKSILLIVIILSITGCLSMSPPGPGTTTKQIKKQIKYKWAQIDNDMSKKEVARILGIPTDVHDSEDIETWKYKYDISRTYGSVSFRRSEDLVWFFSKPSF